MAFNVKRLLIRLIKSNRDFSFVDKIGELTDTLINTIPGTELQRNGQYGALVIINPNYGFQAQITKTENNIDVGIKQENIESDEFKENLSSVLDVYQKILSTIKKTLNYSNNLKSIICQIEGSITDEDIDKTISFLGGKCKNPFTNDSSELRQYSYIWGEESTEKCIMMNQLNGNYNFVYALQDFSKIDMSFSQVRDVINKTLLDIYKNLIDVIRE